MTSSPISSAGLRAALVPALTLALGLMTVGATLAVAGDTLGYDYLAYDAAGRRLLAGQPLYDMSFAASGGFGLFYYPPPFILAVLPFALLPAAIAPWAWIGALIITFAAGVALMPVAREVKWLVALAAVIQWPFVYALKLGQVGPLLFLLFVVGWRWLDRPEAVGGSAAAGAIAKIQPALVLVWAAVAGRWRAVVVGAAGIVAFAVAATVVTGIQAWFDFAELLRRVSDPITTEHNFTPGAVAWQMGVDRPVAAAIQLATTIGVVTWVIVAARRAPADVGYLSAVIGSQLISPVLWDHYIMLTLIPLAWLLARRQWWAMLAPILVSLPIFTLVPPIVYVAILVGALVAPWIVHARVGPAPDVPHASGTSVTWPDRTVAA